MNLVTLISAVRCNFRYNYAILTKYRHTSTHGSAEDQQTNEKYEDDIKNKILEASLGHVNSMGWSKEAIAAGAQELGYPGVTHGMFTRGGGDLVHYFQQSSNHKLVQYMQTKIANVEKLHSPPEFVENAIKHRLQMVIPYLSRWPQAIAIMALPQNVQNALAVQLAMADDICYYAGDRSVNLSWYARRLALATIYKATELYLLQDKSSDFVESWKFLNNRLTEAIQIQNVLLKTDTASKRGVDALSSAFITARNILGMNNR